MLAKFGTLISILGFVQFLSFQGSGQKSVAASPSTQRYETGGPYEIRNGITASERNQILSDIRSFLWNHLREKHLAQIQVTGYTLEGDKTINTFFVDPDEKRHWTIRNESAQWRITPPSGKLTLDIDKETYCEISRIDATSGQTIPKEKERNPDTYKLRLVACVTNENRTW